MKYFAEFPSTWGLSDVQTDVVDLGESTIEVMCPSHHVRGYMIS